MADLRAQPGGSEPDDTGLVEQARTGDVEAFGQLVRRYQRRTVSVAYRLLGSLEDASDVSQEAFVRAFRSLDQLDDPRRFGGWLMRVVCNLSLNFRRSRAGRAASSLDSMALDAPDLRVAGGARSADRGEGGSDAGALSRAISAGLDLLPEKQRLALILFSVEGLPQKEVAEILECSVELVKWSVFQARQKMKVHLGAFL